jgi:hypothetical protein
MPICSDPALTDLTNLGYTAVKLPSTKVQPLDLIGRDPKSTEWLGPMPKLCASSKPPPKIEKSPTSAIDVTRTNALKLGVGIKILRGLLSSFKIDGAALDAAYSNAHSLRLTFANPITRMVSPVKLGEWLLTAMPNAANPVVKHYFANPDPDCKAYVITETLTSDSFSVSALGKNDQHIDVDLPTVQTALGGQLDAKRASNVAQGLTYVGKEFLTFGFKALALGHSFGIWVISGFRPGEAVLGPNDGLPDPYIFDDGWLKLRGTHEPARTTI